MIKANFNVSRWYVICWKNTRWGFGVENILTVKKINFIDKYEVLMSIIQNESAYY